MVTLKTAILTSLVDRGSGKEIRLIGQDLSFTKACWQHSPVAWSLWSPLLQKLPKTEDSICPSPWSQEWMFLSVSPWTSVISSLCKNESRCLAQATVNSDMAGRWIHFRTEDHSRRQKYLNSQGLATQLPLVEDLKIPLNYLKVITRIIWSTQTAARLNTNLNLRNEGTALGTPNTVHVLNL